MYMKIWKIHGRSISIPRMNYGVRYASDLRLYTIFLMIRHDSSSIISTPIQSTKKKKKKKWGILASIAIAIQRRS
ncbi:hypothetical protein ACP275_04G119000 [Erythranthe tilingii]